MKKYIYGAGNNGRQLYQILKEYYDIAGEISGYIDKNKRGELNGLPIYCLDEVEKELKAAQIIIAVTDFRIAKDVWTALKKAGCRDIWWFEEPTESFEGDFYREQCISCEHWQENMFGSVEMHIMDACNLNCRGCTHFSPIFENDIPDFESRISDVKKLTGKNIHIVQFHILGGEPFLNPEINRYVEVLCELLPNSEISIVTNGLLLCKVEDRILQCIHDHNIKVSISEYLPTHKVIDKIVERLKKFHIIYGIRRMDTKEKFNKPLALSQDHSFEKLCISKGCINIWNGKISRCPTLMYIDRFNSVFGTNLPNEGIINLDNEMTDKELVDMLTKEVPLCSHCIKNEIEWAMCGKKPQLEDFAE